MHSVPEIRDYFVSKFRRCTDAIKEHVAEGKQKGKDILDQVERSVSLSLGQLFLEMEEAVAKKGKASVRKFLSRQEDTCELFHVVVTEIEAEEASSEELAAVVPLIKELFGVQKVTQLRCKCGYLLEKEQPPHTTLQVELPTHGKTIPLADCLSQTFAMQPPEGYCCDGCREKNTTSMTESIQSCGDYMLLNLDRAGTNGTSRTSTRVSLPEYINLDQYMRYSQVSPMDEAIPQVRYEVVAFAEHLGTT
ncbi:MAG: hypothetical protein LQ346_006581 [Caloplaca aetnensis]|nr:MAG: hypothetical protein LQ346_006581 [Caloplaca aetnensis]